MDENKTEQYTFGADERATLEKLRQLEASVEQNNQRKNQRELITTKYYSEFIINTRKGPVTLNNVFITAERNKEGEMSYHFRWIAKKENGEQTIEENLVVDENGNVFASEGLKYYLGDAEIDIEELIVENDNEKGRLKGISERVLDDDSQRDKQQDKEDRVQEEEQEAKNQKIEEDLAEQGEEVKIGKYREIKDDKIADRMPEVFEKGKKYGIAEDKVTGDCIIIEKENGQYKKNENVESGKKTTKRIFSIQPNGKLKESEIPDQSMRIKNNPQIELALEKDEYGDLEVQTVQVTPCESKVARPVQMQGQTPEEHQEPKEVTDTLEQKGGEQFVDEIAHKKKELEETYNVTETHIEELRELDIEDLMQEEADRVKISKEGFKEYVKNAEGKTLQEKIHNVQEEIEQEYMGNKRPR